MYSIHPSYHDRFHVADAKGEVCVVGGVGDDAPDGLDVLDGGLRRSSVNDGCELVEGLEVGG